MTKDIHHHPTEETLIAYANGNITGGYSLLLATHLAFCPQCRAEIQRLENIGGAVFAQDEGITVSEGALENVMSKLDALEMTSSTQANTSQAGASSGKYLSLNSPKSGEPSAEQIPELPLPLRDMLPTDFNNLQWRALAPGIKHYPLPVDDHHKGTTRLLKIAPGTCLPEHDHHGSELTLVLKGAYSDEIGRFKAGDIADINEDIRHQPIADTHEDCICLIATDAPLKFTGLVPRMLQSFIGI